MGRMIGLDLSTKAKEDKGERKTSPKTSKKEVKKEDDK